MANLIGMVIAIGNGIFAGLNVSIESYGLATINFSIMLCVLVTLLVINR